MKPSFLTMAVVLLCNTLVFAQKSINWNLENAPLEGFLMETYPISSTDCYTLEIVRKNQWEINPDYLATFYSNGTKVSSKMVVVENMRSTFTFKKAITLKDNLGVFTIGNDSEIKKLKFQTFSKKLESVSEEITIGEYNSADNEHNDNFIIRTSNNGKFFAVIWIARQNSGADLKFHSRVYDDELNLVSTAENTVSFLEGVDLNTVLISDLGQLFLATSNSVSPKRTETPEQFILNLHCLIDSDIITVDVETGNRQISLVGLVSNNMNNATAVGTFFQDGREKWLPGAFSVSADFSTETIARENFQLYENALHTVDQPYQNYLIGPPAKSSPNQPKEEGFAHRVGRLTNIQVEELSDMSIIVILEPRTMSASGSSILYNYGNITLIHFTEEGKLHWKYDVPKRQGSPNDIGNYCSYLSYSSNERVHLLFLDSKNNYQNGQLKTDLDRLSMPRGLAKSDVTALVSIELSTGKATRQIVSNPSTKNIPYPSLCFVDYHKQELLMCAPNKKAIVFGTMKF